VVALQQTPTLQVRHVKRKSNTQTTPWYKRRIMYVVVV
jgi:hypothetical protein